MRAGINKANGAFQADFATAICFRKTGENKDVSSSELDNETSLVLAVHDLAGERRELATTPLPIQRTLLDAEHCWESSKIRASPVHCNVLDVEELHDPTCAGPDRHLLRGPRNTRGPSIAKHRMTRKCFTRL